MMLLLCIAPEVVCRVYPRRSGKSLRESLREYLPEGSLSVSCREACRIFFAAWMEIYLKKTLQWRHNERDGVSNYQPHDCLLSRLFRRRSKKTSKLRVTGFCEGNSPATGKFPAQRASYAEKVSIWWRHHEISMILESDSRDEVKRHCRTHLYVKTHLRTCWQQHTWMIIDLSSA